MEQVELWFIKYEMSHPPTKRRIYLASDEPQVIFAKAPSSVQVEY